MDANEVRKVVSDVPAGTKLRFTYKREETGVLSYLRAMIEGGMLTTFNNNAVLSLCIAVVDTSDWDADQNRTFEVETADKFDVDHFVARVGRELESLEVLT